MLTNNMINSPTISTGWIPFTTTVTATTTAPTYGAGTTINSYYRQQGKMLLLTLSITAVISGSLNGSGTYLFNLPPGFTMNTSIVSFPNSVFALGNATAYAQVTAVYGIGIAQAYDATHYALYLIITNPSKFAGYVSNSFFMAAAGSNLGADLLIPIV